MNYTLGKDGDQLEQYACKVSLLPDRFPSYSVFWESFVVPLTYRPKSVLIRKDSDLSFDAITSHSRICIAQLHYSVLANLIAAWDIMTKKISYTSSGVDLSSLTHFFMNIFAAIDIAEELVVRYKDLQSRKFAPWDDESIIPARREFQKTEPVEIKSMRVYRNRLVHGRLLPGFKMWPDGKDSFVPKIGMEKSYLDWRKITTPTEPTNTSEFQTQDSLMNESFELTTTYLDKMWKDNLIPAA